MLFGPASVVLASALGLDAVKTTVFVGSSFGGTVALAILLLGRYSGAQVNPAVTVAHIFANLVRRGLLVPYLCFQVLGGLLAGLTLRGVLGSLGSQSSLGSTKLASRVSPTTGILLELVGTFALSMSALVASGYVRSPLKQAILVGFTLFILIQLIGPLTGAGLNPARSLGPAFASGYLENQYVYLIGPLAGGVLAGLLFAMVRKRSDKRKNLDLVCMCA